MALLEALAAGIVVYALSIVVYALCRKREVKAVLKVPFAAFFFEAKDRQDEPDRANKIEGPTGLGL